MCAESNGGCWVAAEGAPRAPAQQQCTDTDEGSVCGLCPEGYDRADGGRVCTLILGCSANSPQPGSSTPCYPNVACTSLLPGREEGGRNFRCSACPAGMAGDGIECEACPLSVGIPSATFLGSSFLRSQARGPSLLSPPCPLRVRCVSAACPLRVRCVSTRVCGVHRAAAIRFRPQIACWLRAQYERVCVALAATNSRFLHRAQQGARLFGRASIPLRAGRFLCPESAGLSFQWSAELSDRSTLPLTDANQARRCCTFGESRVHLLRGRKGRRICSSFRPPSR